MNLMVYRRQLLLCRNYQGCFLSLLSGGFSIKSVKNRGANKDGKKQGYYIHADTEKEGLPAADCVKGCPFHGF